VDYISPAIFLPKAIVGCGGIEKQYAVRLACLGGLKQVVGGKIYYNQRNARRAVSLRPLRVIFGLQMQVDEGIALIETGRSCVVLAAICAPAVRYRRGVCKRDCFWCCARRK
jgi:hypothetical protein